MSGFLQRVSDAFWNPPLWLPTDITWQDLEPSDEHLLPDNKHLVIPLGFTFMFLALRYVFERYWFAPLGVFLGLKARSPAVQTTYVVLEKAYRSKEKLGHEQITGLAKQLGWTERQVERWLRSRHIQDKPSTLAKFCENSWKWLYYTFAFCYGVICLWNKPWFWDLNQCYHGYPYHSITTDCWWYYMISFTFYWSLAISQFFDVKRKDFWQMMVHHFATIFLLCFSWIINLHRMGTVVLLVHDCADTFLEAAKCAKYLQYHKACDAIYLVFTVSWIATRCVIFPFWVIHSSVVTVPKFAPKNLAYYSLNGMYMTLLALHIFWTCFILKMAYNSFCGKLDSDIRSSSSEEISDNANYSPAAKKLT